MENFINIKLSDDYIQGGNDKETSELLTPLYFAISKKHFILS